MKHINHRVKYKGSHGSNVQRIIAMGFIEKVQLIRVQIVSGSDIKGSNDKRSIAMA